MVLGRFVPYVTEGFALLDNLKSKPAMLAVGMKDRAISPAVQIADFKGIWPDRPVVKLPNAGHFSQEDAPKCSSLSFSSSFRRRREMRSLRAHKLTVVPAHAGTHNHGLEFVAPTAERLSLQ